MKTAQIPQPCELPSYAHVEHGDHLLPLGHREKKGFPWQVRDQDGKKVHRFDGGAYTATDDLNIWKAFWARTPQSGYQPAHQSTYGLGLAVGPSNRLVLDVDGAEELAIVLERFPMLKDWSLVLDTGRHGAGRHFHFRQPAEPLPNLSDGAFIAKKIEVKAGHGALVRLAGCVHPITGEISRWFDSEIQAVLTDLCPPTWEVPEVPATLAEAIRKAAASGSVKRSSRTPKRTSSGTAADGVDDGENRAPKFSNPGRWGWGERLQDELNLMASTAEPGRNEQAWRCAAWLWGAVRAEVIDGEYAAELYERAATACGITTGAELGKTVITWRSARQFIEDNPLPETNS